MCAHKRLKIFWLSALATLPFFMVSCLSDNEVVTDDHCYILSVSLGTMSFDVHMQDSLGKDTVVRRTYTGTNFPLTINQRDLTIENYDSLLYGTLLRSVKVEISYTGSKVFHRIKDDIDSTWTSYSSEDSLDLRKPIELLTVANDGLSSRCYTLKLNVHKQNGDSLYWKKADDAVPQLQNLNPHQALVVQGRLAVLGKEGNAVSFVERTTDGIWNTVPTNLPADADIQSVVKKGNALFVCTLSGNIYTTTDGKSWQKLNVPYVSGLMLAGATSDYLYALTHGVLFRCYENEQGGWVFQSEALDEGSSYLPSKDVKTLLMTQDNGNRRLVMVGNRTNENDKTSVVWNKMWNKDISESEAIWMFINQTDDNKCVLPQLENLNILQYDGKCLAFGGASVSGKGTNEAMDALYVSRDYGISWRKNEEWYLPKELKGIDGPVSSVVDDDNVIWIIANGQVWRGKLNRLSFLRQ